MWDVVRKEDNVLEQIAESTFPDSCKSDLFSV